MPLVRARKRRSAAPEVISAEGGSCLACGGVGCGLCRTACGVYGALLDKQLEQEWREGVAKDLLLCRFFPVEESIIEALCSFPDVSAALRPRDALFVDLGCGDGHVVLQVARSFSCRSLGVDLDHGLLVEAATAAQCMLPPERLSSLEFRCQDFRYLDLHEASVVYMFLPAQPCHYIVNEVLPRASLPDGVVLAVCGRQDWDVDEDAQCARLATLVTGTGSHGTLHLFRWGAR